MACQRDAGADHFPVIPWLVLARTGINTGERTKRRS